MSAWYNEIDPKKAAQIRELMALGVIAPGVVDERSVADVRAEDLEGFTQCHFFAGVGIWSYALRLAGWPDDREVWTGSCPCQPFSAAGQGKAFDDERHLWPEFFRLIEARRPVVCLGEQVSSIDGLAWLDALYADLDRARYTCGSLDLCAAGVGAPHIRHRLYWVAQRDAGGVADTAIVGHDGRWTGEADGRTGESQRLRDVGGVGHTRSTGLEVWGREPGDAGQERAAAERTGDAGGVANAGCSERRASQREPGRYREASRRDESPDRAGEPSQAERLDNAAGPRRDGSIPGSEGDPRDDAWLRLPGERGPVNGFWAGADWVLTRPQRVGDSPGLRPVEPQSLTLADGATADLGSGRHSGFPLAQREEARVARLRGYGDGIVAQVAATFIRAYMETQHED